MVDGDDSFKRPGAVPFTWEVRPGVPKTQNHRPEPHDYPTLLQPPKKLPPLRLKPLPPSNQPSPSLFSSFNSDSKTRPPSPFAPPSSVRLISSTASQSHPSRPPAPYFRSSSPQAGGFDSGAALPRCFPKSLFRLKKSKSGDMKKAGQESSSSPSPSSSESDKFYESETTFSPSEDSSHGSDSTRWGTPKSSFSYLRDSPLKRNDSDLSSYDKKNHCNYGSVSARLAFKQ